MSPLYLALAFWRGLPGLDLRGPCARLVLRVARRDPRSVHPSVLYKMLFAPMESTRYFEFDFMWQALRRVPIRTYLDVSSPKMFPLLLLEHRREVTATLLNPDSDDLRDSWPS